MGLQFETAIDELFKTGATVLFWRLNVGMTVCELFEAGDCVRSRSAVNGLFSIAVDLKKNEVIFLCNEVMKMLISGKLN